ncbi:uncharacterized protein L969DRAFT_96896 [Mixia osmundae IAM 14324]|uniref:S-methyl-5-thioribose-1-phosphate isomerase n=1 Tax=Mixia osmundae (strain CBS 9802 / IAM 14324 / JCM 22182 / KY 12970) TaxID=764103 RepID=G7E2E7_MIXOS|nr:uncharacterized protein L969DRAFT_96896 [Mixia osmundae IAM 14324]KEI36878.1 hypothetical protein L969DRAFT_96896 [Mixia osmundae IAM 14324]GAA97007.1 hypothetical protein E5Q_03681 [Mixia osmundae IAM 14324]
MSAKGANGKQDDKLRAIRMPDGDPAQFEGKGYVEIVDQLLLPHHIEWIKITSAEQAWHAIRSMQIRGAPAIASLAALGLALDLLRLARHQGLADEHTYGKTGSPSSDDASARLIAETDRLCDYLLSSRPTAVNLSAAIKLIRRVTQANKSEPAEQLVQAIVKTCKSVWQDDIARNVWIGMNGARWLLETLEREGSLKPDESVNVLTVCNTGSLATSDYGTALGVITALHELGRLEHAFYAQTAPYQQGARLTSLELLSLGIPATMVPDTAIAALLAGKKEGTPRIHCFVAGADRIAANGDTANKISTYQISLLCHHVASEQARPKVIIAAPLTTIDMEMQDGTGIVIEQRPQEEAKTVSGVLRDGQSSGKVVKVMFTPEAASVWNPAFDVTPAGLIDAISTEVRCLASQDGAFQLGTLS